MRRPIHLQARGRLAFLLTMPVLVSLVMWWVARRATQGSEWVRHTLLVELSLERCLSGLQSAASEQRGYLVSREERFLPTYREAAREAWQELARLETLSVESPTERDVIARLRPLMEARLAQLELTLSLYQSGGLNSAVFRDGIERGRQLMASIQSLTKEIDREEQSLLETRERALSVAIRRFVWTLVLGYGFIVLSVSSLYRDVRRYGQQREAAEERLVSLNTELDRRVRDRTYLLRAREELLSTFVKHVPAAVAMLDGGMRYLQVSERWCVDYSLDNRQVLGRSHYEIFPELPERWKQIHRRCLAGETLRGEEDRWQRADGQLSWLRWEIRPWGDADGLPEGILIFSEDISERKRSEQMLKESEATTRALLETAAQAILAVDAQGEIVLANRMTGEMFGYEPGDLLGRPQGILLPESREMGTDPVGRRRDGTEFPIEVSRSNVPTTRGPLAVSFISDITARKQAETALRNSEQQLRELAANLLTAQEDERRRVARELHDDVTQTLALLSIELGKLAGELPDTIADKRDRVRALQDQTLRASTEVRRLSHGLHPSVIEDFGLSIALEEFCEEFEKAQSVSVVFEGLGEDSRLNNAGAACLYRVAQESLRNAVQHGRATEIHVALEAGAESLQLTVHDDGIGFSGSPARGKGGLGMVSMRERMRLVNGALTISSAPGQGTRITASVPLSEVGIEESSHSAG